MKKPLVSLIVPMYNAQNYIERCTMCIKNQTYKNLEVIFVDDGSTDSTVEVCKGYASDLPNFKIVSNSSNNGASAARNVGVDNANGDYIAFADVDDYFFEDYIEYLVWLIYKSQADIAVSEYKKTNDIDFNRKCEKKGRIYKYTSEQALEDISYRKKISGSVDGKLIKKDIAAANMFNEKLAYYEDYIYICDLLRCSKSIVVGERITYLYIQNSASSTHNYNYDKCLKSWHIVINKLYDFEEEFPDIKKAFENKELTVSLDVLKKIQGLNYDERAIRKNIHKNSVNVFKDKKGKLIKRIYSFMAFINVDIAIQTQKKILKFLSMLNIYYKVG